MFAKKRLAAVLLCVLTAVFLTAPAFAHGGHHGGCHGGSASGGYTARTVPACGVSGCTVSGTHSHTCVWHSGQVCGGNCAALCTVKDCTRTGRHTHNGTAYCGYQHAAGFCDGSCAALCTVKSCTRTGRHTHNGTTYCGYSHTAGFCDGSFAHTPDRGMEWGGAAPESVGSDGNHLDGVEKRSRREAAEDDFQQAGRLH